MSGLLFFHLVQYAFFSSNTSVTNVTVSLHETSGPLCFCHGSTHSHLQHNRLVFFSLQHCISCTYSE